MLLLASQGMTFHSSGERSSTPFSSSPCRRRNSACRYSCVFISSPPVGSATPPSDERPSSRDSSSLIARGRASALPCRGTTARRWGEVRPVCAPRKALPTVAARMVRPPPARPGQSTLAREPSDDDRDAAEDRVPPLWALGQPLRAAPAGAGPAPHRRGLGHGRRDARLAGGPLRPGCAHLRAAG